MAKDKSTLCRWKDGAIQLDEKYGDITRHHWMKIIPKANVLRRLEKNEKWKVFVSSAY